MRWEQLQFTVTCSATNPEDFVTEGTNSKHSCPGPPADFISFGPVGICIPWSQPPESFPPPSSFQSPGAWKLHQQPAQASVTVWVQDASLDPLVHSTTVWSIGTGPFSCAVAYCWPNAHQQPPLQCAYLRGDCAAPGEQANNQGPHSCYGPGSIFWEGIGDISFLLFEPTRKRIHFVPVLGHR